MQSSLYHCWGPVKRERTTLYCCRCCRCFLLPGHLPVVIVIVVGFPIGILLAGDRMASVLASEETRRVSVVSLSLSRSSLKFKSAGARARAFHCDAMRILLLRSPFARPIHGERPLQSPPLSRYKWTLLRRGEARIIHEKRVGPYGELIAAHLSCCTYCRCYIPDSLRLLSSRSSNGPSPP